MNEDLIAKTNKDINDTIYYLEQAIISLKALKDEMPIASFMHMAKIEQVKAIIPDLLTGDGD